MEEIKHLQSKYFLNDSNLEPRVFIQTTDNWISLYARYIVRVRERREVNSAIHREILKQLVPESQITIASETMTISTKTE